MDNSNRLVIKRKGKKITCDGKICPDKNNQLLYWLNEPSSWRRVYGLPSKVSFQGTWHINTNYDLEFVLNKTRDSRQIERLVIKGEIISTDRDALAFQIKSYDKNGMCHIQLLNLSGMWSSDEHNRIIFNVQKKTTPDILTLKGIWQINKNQQITYVFEKTDLKRKTKISQVLTFKGYWQIDSRNRLAYILEQSCLSRFNFRCQLESPNLYPYESMIKYRIGVGVKKDGAYAPEVISLYGQWKFSRRLGLIFQMDYGRNRLKSIEFGANIHFSKKDEIIFSLINEKKEPLGISVTFTHKFLRNFDAQAFLRLKKLKEQPGIEMGITVPF